MSRCGPSRRPAATALVCVLVVAMLGSGGCGTGFRRSNLRSPLEIRYLVGNPLEEVVSEDQQGDSWTRSLTVAGLKDKAVEARINDRLTAAFVAAKANPLAPYRGVKVTIPDGSQLLNHNVYMYVTASLNNILSVVLDSYALYLCPGTPGTGSSYGGEGNRASCTYMECMTFDLNTGREIGLRDLFTDDVSYLSLLNQAVEARLHKEQAAEDGGDGYMFQRLKLVRPFGGLAAEQEYFLTSYALMLVFDYRTPAFETDLQSVALDFPWAGWEGRVAIAERFYDPARDLFTSDASPAKSLFAGARPEHQERTSRKAGRVQVSTAYATSAGYPAQVQQRIVALAAEDPAMLAELDAAMAGVPGAQQGEPALAVYDLDVSSYVVGGYINVVKQVYAYLPGPGDMQVRQVIEYHCFDRQTAEPVSFGALFVPGYDPAPVVKEALRAVLSDYVLGVAEAESISEAERERLLGAENLDRIYHQLQGMILNPTDVTLSFPPVKLGKHEYSYGVTVTYDTLGAGNLVIFR